MSFFKRFFSPAPAPALARAAATAPVAALPADDRERVERYLSESFSPGSELRRGRSIRDGYTRGWGLQFGRLREQVAADPLYREAMQVAGGRSLMTEDNRMNLFLLLCAYLARLPAGHVIEYGTFRGGNALFMALVAKRVLPGVRVYALDTFAGMPATDGRVDAHSAGDFADVDLAELRDHAAAHGLDNLFFVKGLFEDTAPATLRGAAAIALAHIDCDIYSAVAYAYDVSLPYMVDGGYIVFDDANVSSCLGATEAVEELVIRRDGRFSEQAFPQYVFRNSRG
jgi:predicted O-methyltransferase YrrM